MSEITSSFTHVIKIESGVYALFNSLWLRVIFFDEGLLPLVNALINNIEQDEALSLLKPNLRSEGEKLLLKMSSQKFFGHEEDQNKLTEIRETLESQKISIMYIIVTSTCNLACKYCYLSEALNQENSRSMDEVTASKAIDMFSRIVKNDRVEKPEIIFYGGEPLLDTKLMEFALNYASTIIPNCRFTLNTNGTVINEHSIRLLKHYDVEVSLSIDGPKDIHNRFRIDRSGKGTFSKAITGYKKLQKNNVRVGISCTITPENVNRLEEITNWLIDELNISSLGFNLMIGKVNDTKCEEVYSNNAAKALIECFKIARDAGVYEERVMRRVNSLSDGQLSLNDCGGCGQQIVVTPTGQIGVCQAFMNMGDNFIPIDEVEDPSHHELWAQWRRRSPFNIHECLDCEVLGICGGGCPYNSLIKYGNFMAPDLVHCIHAKETLHFLLKDLWRLSVSS